MASADNDDDSSVERHALFTRWIAYNADRQIRTLNRFATFNGMSIVSASVFPVGNFISSSPMPIQRPSQRLTAVEYLIISTGLTNRQSRQLPMGPMTLGVQQQKYNLVSIEFNIY